MAKEALTRRILKMPDYIEMFTGSYPSDNEINRLLVRYELFIKQNTKISETANSFEYRKENCQYQPG
jgi:hypothetical protein